MNQFAIKGKGNHGRKGRTQWRGKHRREALRKRESPKERPKKRKYQMGNNPRQESSKKLRVKERRERKKERKW